VSSVVLWAAIWRLYSPLLAKAGHCASTSRRWRHWVRRRRSSPANASSGRSTSSRSIGLSASWVQR